MTSKELKPCPFCGNNVEITEEHDVIGESWYRIDCDYCCTHSYIHSDKTKLIKEWNGRPELLPCPICGNPAEIDASEYDSAVFCTKCGVHTDAFDDEKEAVKTWNRRKSNDKL